MKRGAWLPFFAGLLLCANAVAAIPNPDDDTDEDVAAMSYAQRQQLRKYREVIQSRATQCRAMSCYDRDQSVWFARTQESYEVNYPHWFRHLIKGGENVPVQKEYQNAMLQSAGAEAFEKKYPSNKWEIWFDLIVKDEERKDYGPCPPPERNGKGLRDYFKAIEEHKNSAEQCVKRTVKIKKCFGEIGMIPRSSSERPENPITWVMEVDSRKFGDWRDVTAVNERAAGCFATGLERLIQP